MPEICRFYGIIIRMYFDEHEPPHFHAIMSDTEAQIGLDPIRILRGELPNRAFSMAVEWAALHQRELMDNWNRLRADQLPKNCRLCAKEVWMLPRITHVNHIRDYILELTFSNGVKAELDFSRHIVGRGGVFTALQNVEFFRQVRVDPEAGTIVWPNDVDFCPDVLYHEATGQPLPQFSPA